MKKLIRFLFTLTIAVLVGGFFGLLGFLIPGWGFNYSLFFGGILGVLLIQPKSKFAWKVVMSHYGNEKTIPDKRYSEPGWLQDLWEEKDESILIFTGINSEGIILYRPHLIPMLRESAHIPWENLSIRDIVEPSTEEGELVDQVAPMLVQIKIKGVAPSLELPWNKELELYKNISLSNVQKAANK